MKRIFAGFMVVGLLWAQTQIDWTRIKNAPVTGGNVLGQAISVDGEIALFNGTTGKQLKRATTTGVLTGTSGVLGAVVGVSTDCVRVNGTSTACGSGSLATQAQAEAGVENTAYMSSLRVAQAIVAQSLIPSQVSKAFAKLMTDGSALSFTWHDTIPDSGAQTIDAVTDTISADRRTVEVTLDNDYTLISTPTIADGDDGQLLIVVNPSVSYNLTLQDEANLAGSNIRNKGTDVIIALRSAGIFIFNQTDSTWYFLGSTGGGSSTTTAFITYPAAGCQQGVAATPFVIPSSNYPTAACILGSNITTGELLFGENGTSAAQSVQGSIYLPTTWTGAIDVYGKWRAVAITGDVVWQIQTACVADAETSNPSLNGAQTIIDTVKGTTLQQNDFSMTGLTTTGCVAGKTLYFKFFRDATDGSDSLGGSAGLLSLGFKVRRTN